MEKVLETNEEIPVKERLDVKVIKKSGNLEPWDTKKILKAVGKSAARIATKLSYIDQKNIIEIVEHEIDDNAKTEVPVEEIHSMVEKALTKVRPDVAQSYKDYRNWIKKNAQMMEDVTKECNTIQFIGDKSNANADSNMVSTKRVKKLDVLETAQYREYFLNSEEKKAEAAGYIYVHDKGARQDTMNCFDRSTRFITSQGVKSFYDFCDGDEIIVLTHTGEWKKATVHSYGWQKLQKVTFKRGASNEKEVLVTENHRWLLKDGTETTNLKVGDKLIATPDITKFDFSKLSKENKKLWCLGFAFADGSITPDNNIPTMHVRICGDKSKYINNFIEAGYSVTYPNSQNGDAHVRMKDIHSKELPYLLLDYRNIIYFVNGYLSADGNRSSIKNTNSEFRGVQVTGKFNDYVYDLLNIAGYYVTGTKDLTGQLTNYGTQTKETISYTVYSNCGDRTWFVSKIEPAKLNINAQVWCLEVKDNHSFILENGIPTGNCCIFDVDNVLTGGFEMGNIWYNEPKSLDVAFDVIGDITLMAASQQYGGFTIPEVDKLLSKYAEKTYQSTYQEEYEDCISCGISEDIAHMKAERKAEKQVEKEMRQGYQGWEYKFNTVASSRGDYPFLTITFGLATDKWGKLASKTILQVHAGGQGKKEKKKPVLFPKLVFLYDENLHGHGCVNEDVFEEGVNCSSKTMYPDWLDLTGPGYVPSMYKQYGKVVSPMGCRAFLSPWYVKGGIHKQDKTDVPVFVGRGNIGVVSLNLPMILAKSRRDCTNFYNELDYYLEMIKNLHIRTYDYLSQMPASTNPLGYCEGGFYGGHLNLTDKIGPVIKTFTASFGITALNELQELYNGKSIVEDGQFALEVMEYINKKITEFKEETGYLMAIYGTPRYTWVA